MVACSFLPAVTQMIYDMDLQHLLQGVTFECPSIALAEKPRVVRYVLSNPNGDSIVTPWRKVLRYDPEVLIIAPCGFDVKRSMEELHLLTSKPEWNSLQAVKHGNVFIVDFDLFTQPSASTLVDGIEMLASLFHPQ